MANARTDKITKNQKKENVATIDGGMAMGVYTGVMPKNAKTNVMRGYGAATKGRTFSKNG